MRIAQKKQTEEFVELLGQAHEEIRSTIEKKNIPAAMSLLADCQDGAIALGELIESAEGEAAATIPILEKYCELVYEIHQGLAAEMDGGTPVRADKAYKTLRQGHIRIVNSVTHDIKVRREVVFLPYKASMWDSLESVWKAAADDPDCDAYVVPIPYYDKNPDGSFRELHYEGGQYPGYVPVVWYEDYDFEKRRPDMIFIHNPYDDCNIVTSVHPFFYSKNLKKFTEKLVYIPYFILGEIDPENKQELEGIEKFCLVPGVVYADQVIVQSEGMRQAYINVLTEFLSGQGRSREYWEKKILGLGSPKVDKVLNTRREDLEIPEEWMRIIQKPDGSWKKIIFYNTSVTALLQHNEQYLVKMRDVFRVFYENRDEVALLWRPHPLFASTIQAMRPELGEEYRGIVEGYRRDGWGIYDDSSDMDRAVCLSDAYYGDRSSVVHLYQIVGKKYAIQTTSVLANKDVYFCCADIVCNGDRIFILTRDTQSLFEYYPKTGRVTLCGTVASRLSQSYISMVLCSNKLYIAPYEADEVCIYDIEKEEFERLLIGQSQNGLIRRHYQLCFSHNGRVYLLGSSGTTMLYIDVMSNHIEEITEWIEEFKKRYYHDAAVRTHMNVCIVEDCFWVALNSDNVLLQYNMQTDKYRFWKVGTRRIQYITVCYDGDYFWLSGDEKFIVRWKKDSNEVREYDCFPNGFECGNKEIGWNELFSCSYLWNGNLYFAPLNSNMVIRLDRNSGEMECVLRIEDCYICPKMVKLEKQGIYIEVELCNSFIVAQSCLIDSDNILQPYSIKIDKFSDIVFENNTKKNHMHIQIESYSNFLADFLEMLKSEGISKAFLCQIIRKINGRDIFRQIRECD